MTDGEKIKSIREDLKLNQDEMSERMGIKQQSLSHLESGRNKEMSFTSFKAIVNKCGVNPYYFLTDNPKEPKFLPLNGIAGMRKKLSEYDKLADKMAALKTS